MRGGAISGVVLAAGPSRRFGQKPPKQLAEVGGEPLVRKAARVALESRLAQVIVVVGWVAEQVAESVADLPVEVVLNRSFATGQSTSVRAGLAVVDEEAAAAMFLPVDQPGLTVEVLDALIDLQVETEAAIVVPTFAGRRGAPVVIGRPLFAELERIEGDTGGRQLFSAFADSIVELPLASSDPLADVDTPADLERFGG